MRSIKDALKNATTNLAVNYTAESRLYVAATNALSENKLAPSIAITAFKQVLQGDFDMLVALIGQAEIQRAGMSYLDKVMRDMRSAGDSGGDHCIFDTQNGSVSQNSGSDSGAGQPSPDTQMVIARDNSSSDGGVGHAARETQNQCADVNSNRESDGKGGGQNMRDTQDIPAPTPRIQLTGNILGTRGRTLSAFKPRHAAAAKIMAMSVGIYDEKLMNGARIGHIQLHALRKFASEATRQGAWARLIVECCPRNADEFAKVKDLVSEETLRRTKQKAAEVEDAH